MLYHFVRDNQVTNQSKKCTRYCSEHLDSCCTGLVILLSFLLCIRFLLYMNEKRKG